ncbi:MAG: phenylalanine--tRNA ligase subunit beta [Pseudomonadota bacterium]
MKVSEQWLKEWTDPGLTSEAIAERLTIAGLEVDAVLPAAPDLGQIMVAEVLEREPHPKSDRLSLCKVVAGGEPIQVVCGAPNVRAGMKAVYIPTGAVLPSGQEISAAEIRGVESFGMLCSEVELELGDDGDGIIELPGDAPVGQSLADYLALDDFIFDIDLTPNRGDCFSMVGVARDLSAMVDSPLKAINVPRVAPAIEDSFDIKLSSAQACPRYAGRIIRGIDPNASTPVWMRERLRRAGVRPISPLVDVTNYVMLELGQPMHAFDFAKLTGGIEVRDARDGESLELLDGKTVELTSGHLVIADHQRAVALAGVMGGAGSAVGDTTVDVFLESAFFAPLRLAGVARAFKLHTDAATRFERGVDWRGQVRGIERATQLVIDICGGSPGPVLEAVSEVSLPDKAEVLFDPAAPSRLLGKTITEEAIESALVRLQFEISKDGPHAWRVTAPSHRFDIAIEADLIEEIARIEGYDTIPSNALTIEVSPSTPAPNDGLETVLRHGMVSLGYQEVINYSFIDPQLGARFNESDGTLPLANPISLEMSQMRRSLWPGLLQSAIRNLNRQHARLRLAEIGAVFHAEEEEKSRFAGLMCGPTAGKQWGEDERQSDFFDLKHDVERILALLGYEDVSYGPIEDPALHPGQAAGIFVAEQQFGKFGMLHPELQRDFDLEIPIFLFEFETDKLEVTDLKRYLPLSKFPAVSRDLNVVVDETVSAERCLAVAREAGGELLKDLQLFSVYRGQGIDSDKKSLTLGLIFQALSSTLTDVEVDEAVSRVLARLQDRVGASLRV